jgi:hypothetical protein
LVFIEFDSYHSVETMSMNHTNYKISFPNHRFSMTLKSVDALPGSIPELKLIFLMIWFQNRNFCKQKTGGTREFPAFGYLFKPQNIS